MAWKREVEVEPEEAWKLEVEPKVETLVMLAIGARRRGTIVGMV